MKGTGYTDHCPRCLWSRHVDVNPGDRKADCRGMMKPVGASSDRKGFTINYVCTKCWSRKSVKASEEDNKDLIFELVESSRRH